jgi:hypothetical protein
MAVGAASIFSTPSGAPWMRSLWHSSSTRVGSGSDPKRSTSYSVRRSSSSSAWQLAR